MQQVDSPEIGLLGLERLGVSLAHALLDHDIPLRLFDSEPDRLRTQVRFREATVVDQQGQLACPGGLVISVLPNEHAALNCAVGEQGVLTQLEPAGLHCCLAPLSPAVAVELERLYAHRGCLFLAGALLAGAPSAPREPHAPVTLLLSDSEAAKARLLPIVSQAVPTYDLGNACEAAPLVGLVTTLLTGTAIEALGEALALLDAFGVARDPVFQLLGDLGWPDRQWGEIRRRLRQQDFVQEGDTSLSVTEGMRLLRLIRKVATTANLAMTAMEPLLTHVQEAQAADHGSNDWTILSTFAGESVGRLTRRRA